MMAEDRTKVGSPVSPVSPVGSVHSNTSLLQQQQQQHQQSSVRQRQRTDSVGSVGSSIPSVGHRGLSSLSAHHISEHDPENTSASGEGDGGGGGGEGFFTMSRQKKFTVLTFCFANFCVGAFYSLLAPFFPQEALKKGVSQTLTGLIFGSFELVLICFSPLFGSYLTTIGAKFLYCSGVLVCGCTTILFGFLDMSPPGATYIGLCFSVRFLEGIAAAAFITASFAIMANTFPDNVSAMFGSLELFSGLGLMIGPPIGGALYQVGGFRLPFIVMGSLLFFVGLLSVFLLPPQDDLRETEKHSLFSILRLPVVLIMGYLLMAGMASIGFMDIALAIHLTDKFQLSPVILGLVFLVGPGVYAISAPLWGWISDKKPELSCWLICGGYLVGGVGFIFMGPAPFLGIPNDLLWLIILCLGFMGFGIGTIVIAFGIISNAAKAAGHEESLAMFGLVSGAFNLFACLGAFIGPLGGGALVDAFGFEWSAFVIGCIGISGSLLLFAFQLCKDVCCYSMPNQKTYMVGRRDVERQPQGSPVNNNGRRTQGNPEDNERQPLLAR